MNYDKKNSKGTPAVPTTKGKQRTVPQGRLSVKPSTDEKHLDSIKDRPSSKSGVSRSLDTGKTDSAMKTAMDNGVSNPGNHLSTQAREKKVVDPAKIPAEQEHPVGSPPVSETKMPPTASGVSSQPVPSASTPAVGESKNNNLSKRAQKKARRQAEQARQPKPASAIVSPDLQALTSRVELLMSKIQDLDAKLGVRQPDEKGVVAARENPLPAVVSNAQSARDKKHEVPGDEGDDDDDGPHEPEEDLDLADVIRAWHIPVWRINSSLKTLFEELHIPYRIVDGYGPGPQGAYTLYAYALTKALIDSAVGRLELRVKTSYIPSRVHRFNPDDVPLARVRGGDYDSHPVSARQVFSVVWAEENCHVAVIGEPYLDNNASRTISVEYVRQMILSVHERKVYVIARPFRGYGGVDDFPYALEASAIWLRGTDGILKMRVGGPQNRVFQYCDSNWLFDGSQAGIVVEELEVIGPYTLFRCRLGELPPATQVAPRSDFLDLYYSHCSDQSVPRPGDWLPQKLKVWLYARSVIKWWLPGQWRVCYSPSVARHSSSYGSKLDTGTSLESCMAAIRQDCKEDPRMSRIADVFPSDFHGIVWATAVQCIYGSRSTIAKEMASLKQDFALEGKQIQFARSPTVPPVDETGWWVTVRRLSALTGLQLLLGQMGPAVYMEELARLASPEGMQWVGLVELVGYCAKLRMVGVPLSKAVLMRLPALFLHVFLSRLTVKNSTSFTTNVMVHASFNLLAALLESSLQLTPVKTPTLPAYIPEDSVVLGSRVGRFLIWIQETWQRQRQQISDVKYAIRPDIQDARQGLSLLSRPLRRRLPELSVFRNAWFARVLKLLRWKIAVFENKIADWTSQYPDIFGLLSTTTVKIALTVGLSWFFLLVSARAGRGNRRASLLEAFMSSRLSPQTDFPVGWSPLPEEMVVPSTLTPCPLPPVERGELKVKLLGDNRAYDPRLLEGLLAEGKKTGGIYPIMITQRLLHQPAKCDYSMLIALLTRLHAQPFRVEERIRHENWAAIGAWFCGERKEPYQYDAILPHILFEEKTFEEAVSEMDSKKAKRIKNAWLEAQLGIERWKGTEIMQKCDETLPVKFDEKMSLFVVKPRAIVNFPALLIAQLIAPARSLADSMHMCFDGRPYIIGDTRLRILFASGLTQPELTRHFVDFRQSGDAYIMVAGDDSIVNFNGAENTLRDSQGKRISPLADADLSKFDQSQDEGPLFVFMSYYGPRLGWSPELISIIQKACTMKYNFRGRDIKVDGYAGMMMPTGIPFTTTLSSLHCIAMYLWIFHNLAAGYTGNVEALVEQIGFNIKFASKETYGTLTFLRGWWVPGTWEWVPLPSQVLKLGKILRDPIRIFPGPRKVALGNMAYAIAASYGTVPNDYPILGTFLRVLKRFGVEDVLAHTKLESLIESWAYKVRLPSIITISRKEALLSMEMRYGLLETDICDVEDLIRSVDSLPALVSHPVFDVLANVDYL